MWKEKRANFHIIAKLASSAVFCCGIMLLSKLKQEDIERTGKVQK